MVTLTLVSCAVAAAEVLLTDSFERPGAVPWRHAWGPAERTQEIPAQDGQWSLRETVEDHYGLSVWYVELDGYPGATYRASAWVYVPSGAKVVAPALALNRMDWSPLALATTGERDRWVRLSVECRNVRETQLRLQLYQDGQTAGVGGAVIYWDNVTLEREMGALPTVEDGIRINPHVLEGLDVTPIGGMKLRVAPGKIDVDGVAVAVEETVVELAPPRLIQVRDERTTLTDQEPRGYGQGTPLRGCIVAGITIADCVDPASIVVKSAAGAQAPRFQEGKDWRADKQWARIGRLPEGAIGPDTPVFVDYDYSLMRVDTLEVRSDGKLVVRTGAEHQVIPEPPALDMHARGLCNVFLPYLCRELRTEHIYPLGPAFPQPGPAEVERNAALIPRSIEKLTRGEDFTLLFWGDSVTCGGDASTPEKAFPLAFTTWLRNRYPQAHIRYVNAGTGGWNTASKLPLFQEEVLDKKPDLVVIEFVNDMGFDRDTIFRNWGEAVRRIREIGGEVIILTPHFVRPDWMGATDLRTPETRAAVGYLREFAAENQVALADASRRWAHLWIEGLPYLTLLYNSINHPDDRGHRIFVEELQKFFPPAGG